MSIEDEVTNTVTRNMSEEDAERYRELSKKDFHSLSQEDRDFVFNSETSALTRSMGLNILEKGEVAGCTCNAGLSDHRSYCPMNGQPSGASDIMRLLGL